MTNKDRLRLPTASRALATALFGGALASGLLGKVAVVPQTDGVNSTESGKPAPSIIEGRP